MSEYSHICWVITGAGHFLRETADFLCGLPDFSVDLYLTRAGVEVAARYGQMERMEARGFKVFRENDYSSSGLIYFSSGRHDALVIAPATSNTVAKCALGIADSLASNFFAQAGKSGVPIFVLPTDTEGDITSITPSGKKIQIRPRMADLDRVRELSRFPGVTVLRSPEEFGVLRQASQDNNL
ncbi:MAG: flavoprotein [Synergistaceae bacterium]|jgi:flavoprotein|nr:flavoprotein [Synergistaceae bacterium]